jgi:hypothetical protein
MASLEWVEKEGKKVAKYSWQPKLEDGTPLGGVQVAEADSAEEVAAKIADQYNHLYLRNRELMRERELSGKNVPEGAKTAAPAAELKTRPLTPAERLAIVKGINDPEKVDEVLELAIEAKLGAKPEAVATRIDSSARNAKANRDFQVSQAWAQSHPEFIPTQKNCEDMAKWIDTRGLEVSAENLDKAFTALAALLEQDPAAGGNAQPSGAANTPEAPALAAPKTKPASPAAPALPTTPTRKQVSSSSTLTPVPSLTREMIERMPAAEYDKRMKDPSFVKKVNDLYSRSVR